MEKITLRPGRKGKGDQIIFYHESPVTIKDLIRLIGAIGVNELHINEEAIEATGNFFFVQAIREELDLLEDGVLDDNEIERICDDYSIIGG